MCFTTPVVEAPFLMVEHVLPAPVAESVARVPVVSYTAPTPMDDFSASVPDVSHAASTSSSAPTPAHADFEEWTAQLRSLVRVPVVERMMLRQQAQEDTAE